jgi:hypothetical protein
VIFGVVDRHHRGEDPTASNRLSSRRSGGESGVPANGKMPLDTDEE